MLSMQNLYHCFNSPECNGIQDGKWEEKELGLLMSRLHEQILLLFIFYYEVNNSRQHQ
jgi:hypothetical protein